MTSSVDFALHQCPDLESFERSTRTISTFLGPPPSLLLSEACAWGTVATLDWIWAASCTSAEKRTPGWALTNYLRSDQRYYRWQFSKSLLAAAERGDMAIVEWLFAHFVGCEASGKKVLLAAAKRGHLRVFRFLWERRSGARDGSGQAASSQESNHLAPCPCTIQVKDTYNVGRWRRVLIEQATENGQLIECLRDGMQLQDYERYYAISHALALGDCKLAELLLPDGEVLLYYAPRCPPPELVEVMVKMEHFPWSEDRTMDVVAHLAAKGSLELMQQLFQRFSPLKEDQACWQRIWRDAMEAACTHGHLLVLQWLMNHPLGRAEVFTCENRSCVCSGLVRCASPNGHVDILQYMLEQGVFKEAIMDGNIIDHICECHIDSVQWLVDHDLIGDQQLFSYAIARAALYGRVDILRLFQALDAAEENGVVGTKRNRTGRQFSIWGGNRDTFYWAAKGGHVAVLDWLQRNYPAPCEADAMDIAASRGHLDAVKWLHSNRTEGCTISAMYLAARNGHFEVVKWLYVNRAESHSIAGIAKAVQYGHLSVAHLLSNKFPEHTLSRYSVGFHKRLVSLYSKTALEMLLFLQVRYPSIFTPSFLEELRKDLSELHPKEKKTASALLSWLDENYPCEPQDSRS